MQDLILALINKINVQYNISNRHKLIQINILFLIVTLRDHKQHFASYRGLLVQYYEQLHFLRASPFPHTQDFFPINKIIYLILCVTSHHFYYLYLSTFLLFWTWHCYACRKNTSNKMLHNFIQKEPFTNKLSLICSILYEIMHTIISD